MNHRQKKKKVLITGLCIVFSLVVGITIAYAALSETLNISGSAEVKSSNWDIRIANYNDSKTNGSATYTEPTITGTTVANYTVSLTKPGDSVEFYFTVRNHGTLDAEILSIVNSTPVCTSATGNTEDAELVCNNLEITFTNTHSPLFVVGGVVGTNDYYCYNGDPYGDYYLDLKLIIKLKDSMTSVPSSKVIISNLSNQVIFGQTTKTCNPRQSCFVTGTKVLTESGYKNIEDINEGEYVYAMNLDTNNYELKLVEKKINSYAFETYEITIGEKVIEATGKHPFYVIDKGWVQAADLVVGDELSSMENTDTTITKIERKTFKEQIPVYNMEIEGHHNYLVTEDGFLVHNANSPS